MVRIDMSEFMEKHSVARLIGAPPGYVGYEEGGYLTEAVRRHPYSVILLDEVEKAHPDVFNVLLQVLDDGRMTDGQGRTVDFKNTVIVMTSNLGSSEIQEMIGESRESVKNAVMTEVREHFRPEFINRIDEIVIFNSLGSEAIRRIAAIQLESLQARVAAQDVTLEVTGRGHSAELAEGGLRSALRRTSAQARDPGPHRESSCDGHARGFRRSRRHDPRGREGRQVHVRRGEGRSVTLRCSDPSDS